MPIVSNFSAPDYHAALSNWCVTQGENGEIYVGNSKGVLEFDGYHWTKHDLPGDVVVRSVLYKNGRLYVGMYEDFGYLTPDKYGNLQYTSLWKQLKGYKPHNDEIWKIIPMDDGRILFQSFCSWFEYDGKTVRAHYDPSFMPLYFFKIGKKIYVQRINGGFGLLEGTRFKPLYNHDALPSNVIQVLQWDAKSILLVTEFDGVYRYDGKNLTPFYIENEQDLRLSQANRATLVDKQNILVIGTIRDGIYGYSRAGKLLWHYNVQNRLVNNTVLGLFCDKDNNLWAALDAGVALIHTSSAYMVMTDRKTPLGTVYDVYDMNSGLYISTNQATWFIKDGSKQLIAGTEGQNWHLTRFGNHLIVGNNLGTKVIQGTVATPLPGSGPASSTAIRRYMVSDTHDYLIESSYSDLRVYRNVGGEWHFQNVIKNFMAPIGQFEIDANGDIWAAHMSRGLYRLELSNDLSRVAKTHYYTSLTGIDTGNYFNVVKINGHIIIGDGKKLYTYNGHRFVPFSHLDRILQGTLISVTPVDSHRFWVSTDRGYHLITYEQGHYKPLTYVSASFLGLLCGDKMNNVRIFNHYAYFCMYGGVGRVDMARLTAQEKVKPHQKILLQEAFYYSKDKEKIYLPVNGEKAEAYGDVEMRFSYPNLNSEPLQFRFTVRGRGIDKTFVYNTPNLVLNNLGYGNYTILADVIDADGTLLSSTRYAITFPLPFFLSVPMLFLYVCLLVLGIWLFSRWRTKKALEQQKKLNEEEQMRQQLQLMEQQRIIDEQQRKLLDQQVQTQGKEILSLAMQKIQTGGENNDAYWKLYQDNFDLIHEQFFRRLRQTYPSLTATDLKFCALLRLNLSTKDMARFTGLTLRGVEGARYRIRKKMQLSESQNLTEFLIDFK